MKTDKKEDNYTVISNHDIEELLSFAVRDLGSYRLIYKKDCYRNQFILILILAILAGVMSLFAYLCSNLWCSKIAMLLSGFLIVSSFIFGYRLRENAKPERMDLQNIRCKMLEIYYSKKGYDLFQIEQVCEMLKMRKGHMEKNIICVLLIAGPLFLSLWNAYVQKVISNNPAVGFLRILLFLGLRIIVLLFFIAVLAPFFGLLRELNFSSFSQIYLIENLAYLTAYIIHKKRTYISEKDANSTRENLCRYCKRRYKHERRRRG